MLPEWPTSVPPDQRQVKGDQKTDNLAESHRRNPSLAKKPDPTEQRTVKPWGPLRYREVEE